MTAPHPALLDLASGRPPAPIDDEAKFLRSVGEHRMVATVLAAHQEGAIGLSPATATALGMWDLAERRAHLLFWQTVHEVEQRLAPVGAAVAVLKGIATESQWYDGLGQRACTDVDLLLDPGAFADLGAVVDALDPGRGDASTIEWLVGRRLLQHVDLRVGATQVDLHFDALKVGIPTRQAGEVWASARVVDTPHGTIRVLRPEIELVLLLLHLNKDRFAYLGPFFDIARILERADLDHGYLRRFVAAEGLDVPVWKSLVAVTATLGIDPGVDVPRPTGPRAWSWDRLWGARVRLGGHEARERAPSVQRFLAAHASGRARDTLRELRRQVVPRRELLEVAGRLEPGRSYLRYLAVDRRRFLASARPE